MYNIEVVVYNEDFITIDKDGQGVRLTHKGYSKRYIGYTLEEALKLFKEEVKGALK